MPTSISNLAIRPRMSSTNINFLFGSGASRPTLATLGNIETLMSEALNDDTLGGTQTLAYVQLEFFRSVLLPNKLLVANGLRGDRTGEAYIRAIQAIRALIQRRDSATDGRRARLFTTNYDLYLELALEHLGAHYEDGFVGRVSPRYDSSSFGATRTKVSASYGNSFESPSFDVRKLHGSLSWRFGGSGTDGLLQYSRDYQLLDDLDAIASSAPDAPEIDGKTYTQLKRAVTTLPHWSDAESFSDEYSKLPIVNPTPSKYSSTLLTQVYYEQLRALANELDRPSTTLIVIGFSFEDSHIRDLITRAAQSNPTLSVIAFAYDSAAETRTLELLQPAAARNRNIIVQGPVKAKRGARVVPVLWTLANVSKFVLEPALPASFSTEPELR